MKPVQRAPKPCVAATDAIGVRCAGDVDQSITSACDRVLTGSPRPMLTDVPSVVVLA